MVYVTITVDPTPEFTAETFMRVLHSTPVLEVVMFQAVTQGRYVVVTLIDFDLARWCLEKMGQLPTFAKLLAAED